MAVFYIFDTSFISWSINNKKAIVMNHYQPTNGEDITGK